MAYIDALRGLTMSLVKLGDSQHYFRIIVKVMGGCFYPLCLPLQIKRE